MKSELSKAFIKVSRGIKAEAQHADLAEDDVLGTDHQQVALKSPVDLLLHAIVHV